MSPLYPCAILASNKGKLPFKGPSKVTYRRFGWALFGLAPVSVVLAVVGLIVALGMVGVAVLVIVLPLVLPFSEVLVFVSLAVLGFGVVDSVWFY
jgi:hypothetical protein